MIVTNHLIVCKISFNTNSCKLKMEHICYKIIFKTVLYTDIMTMTLISRLVLLSDKTIFHLTILILVCADGLFGVNCASSCGECLNQPCDKVSGQCPAGGCTAGYTGTNCDQSNESFFHIFCVIAPKHIIACKI